MTIKIEIPAATEARLRERAAAEGKDPASYVLQVVQDELAEHGDMVGDGTNGAAASASQRLAELRAWASSHPASSHEADDRRETLYEGRGE